MNPSDWREQARKMVLAIPAEINGRPGLHIGPPFQNSNDPRMMEGWTFDLPGPQTDAHATKAEREIRGWIVEALSAAHAAGGAESRSLLSECRELLDLLPPGRYGSLRERIDRHMEDRK